MTTIPLPAAGSPAWRVLNPVPADVRFEVGPFCPIDDTHLHGERHTGLPGWVCPTCRAWWDRRGRNGQWLTDPACAGPMSTGQVPAGLATDAPAVVTGRRRVGRYAAAGVGAAAVAVLVYGGGRALRAHPAAGDAEVPDAGVSGVVPGAVLWTAAAVLAAVAAVLLAVALLTRWRSARRYGRNRLLGAAGAVDAAGIGAAGSEVRDGR